MKRIFVNRSASFDARRDVARARRRTKMFDCRDSRLVPLLLILLFVVGVVPATATPMRTTATWCPYDRDETTRETSRRVARACDGEMMTIGIADQCDECAHAMLIAPYERAWRAKGGVAFVDPRALWACGLASVGTVEDAEERRRVVAFGASCGLFADGSEGVARAARNASVGRRKMERRKGEGEETVTGGETISRVYAIGKGEGRRTRSVYVGGAPRDETHR